MLTIAGASHVSMSSPQASLQPGAPSEHVCNGHNWPLEGSAGPTGVEAHLPPLPRPLNKVTARGRGVAAAWILLWLLTPRLNVHLP